MAIELKIGDIVWAKMKGFQPWPGKVVEPNPEVKKPSDKKPKQYVFFFGTENYAWINEELIWQYVENREKYKSAQRHSRAFLDAVEKADELMHFSPSDQQEKPSRSPSPESAAECCFESQSVTPPKPTTAEAVRDSPKSIEKSKSIPKPKKSDELKSKTNAAKKDKKDATEERTLHKKRSAPDSLFTPSAAKTRLLEKDPESPLAESDTLAGLTSSMYDFDTDALPSQPSSSRPTGGMTEDERRALLSDQPFLPDVLTDTTFVSKNIIATPLKIGFLGLGLMGSGMVDNLLRSGHEVTVWNRTTSKCREYIRDGALKGNSPAEVVQSCDITFSCVSDQTALKDVVFGPCGILQSIESGKGYVDMSTVDVESIKDISEAVVSRGGRFLEAPVFGNKQLAKNGQLVIMAAGDKTLYEDCSSCFQAMSRNMFFLGELGCATKMNLILNYVMGTTLAGLAEGMALAEKVGLNTAEMLNILSQTPVSSPFLRTKGTEMALSRISELSCKLLTLQKDLRLAINMSDSVDQPLHVGAAVNELFKKAKAKGYGEYDISAVYRAADL